MRLPATKRRLQRRRYGRTKPGALLKHHIPLKTNHWDVTVRGFTWCACGRSGRREFAHSLSVTNIDTTWVETWAVLGRGEGRVQAALDGIRRTCVPPAADRLGQRLEFINDHLNTHLCRPCQAETQNGTYIREVLDNWLDGDASRRGRSERPVSP